jgi:hypothetical protein
MTTRILKPKNVPANHDNTGSGFKQFLAKPSTKRFSSVNESLLADLMSRDDFAPLMDVGKNEHAA